MPFIVKVNRIKFSASHFLREPLKCSQLHGHNYYISVELSSALDENFFVVDFIDLKKKVKLVTKSLDHYVLIPKHSKNIVIKEIDDTIEIMTNTNKRYVLPKSDVTFLPLQETTSELLAQYLHGEIKKIYPDKRVKVILEESKSTMAIYEE